MPNHMTLHITKLTRPTHAGTHPASQSSPTMTRTLAPNFFPLRVRGLEIFLWSLIQLFSKGLNRGLANALKSFTAVP
jgi:hypothetical protein